VIGYLGGVQETIHSQPTYYSGPKGARAYGKPGTDTGYTSSIISQDIGGHDSGSVYDRSSDTDIVIGCPPAVIPTSTALDAPSVELSTRPIPTFPLLDTELRSGGRRP
jgi:hypothetical protein